MKLHPEKIVKFSQASNAHLYILTTEKRWTMAVFHLLWHMGILSKYVLCDCGSKVFLLTISFKRTSHGHQIIFSIKGPYFLSMINIKVLIENMNR